MAAGRLSAVLLSGALLGTAGALKATIAKGHEGSPAAPGEEAPPLTAFCLAGNGRAMTRPEVKNSLIRYLTDLETRGIEHDTMPDVFASVTLRGTKASENVTSVELKEAKEDVKTALDSLNPTRVRVYPLPHPDWEDYEVTSENVRDYIDVNSGCWDAIHSGYFQDPATSATLLTSLNHWVHIEECANMIRNKERMSHGIFYDTIMIARPDLKWGSTETTDLYSAAFKKVVQTNHDRVMLFPRSLLDAILPSGKRRFVHCLPGEPCCGQVLELESFIDLKMGLRLSPQKPLSKIAQRRHDEMEVDLKGGYVEQPESIPVEVVDYE